MARRSAYSFSVIALALLFAGCDIPADIVPPEYVKMFNDQVGSKIGVKITVAASQPTPKPSASVQAEESPAPDHRAVNAQFIKELFLVVLQRDVRGEEEFLKYMNVMDQGGHYEGIYNGIVYAEEYRAKEKGVAPIGALKNYADVMAQITLDQKYDPMKIAKAKAEGDAPQPDVPNPDKNAPAPQATEAERAKLVSEFQREGITKSLYALKRTLGEQVLKTIDIKKEYKEKFATWYGRFTVYLNKKGIDFGLPERNKTDEYFHYKWALDADEDRLKWETLNRVHRLENSQAK
jgi:hypothetical protein